MKVIALLLSLWVLSGCKAGEGSNLDENGQPLDPNTQPPVTQPPEEPDTIQPTLTSIQDKVLTPICTQCHIGGGAPLGLQMDDLATSIANLIDVDSATNPQFKRVSPNQPDQSFFYLKIIGDPQAGNQMPLAQTPLSSEVQAVIRTWIENGAPIDDSQLVVGQNTLSFAKDTLTLAVQFSQPIEQSSLSIEDIHLTAKTENSEWDASEVTTQIEWLTPNRLSIQFKQFDPQIKSINISLNQNQLSSVISTSGNLLDGDKDGIPGGEVHYEYTFK
jgi:hypothetical protein